MRKRFYHLLASMALVFAAVSADAFVIAVPTPQPSIKSSTPTHLIVVGRGKDMGLGFLESAVAQTKKYQAIYPEHQVVIFAVDDDGGGTDSVSYLKNRNFTMIQATSGNLKMANITRAVEKYNLSRLESMDVISHNAPTFGSVLESNLNRMKPEDDELLPLKSRFAETFYIKLHGCNSGYGVAPGQANTLGVLVLGTLTSTNLTTPHSDGFWYYNDKGQYPESAPQAKDLLLSDTQSMACKGTLCSRLMPVRSPYNGYWGQLDAGLPYFKAFCPVGKDEQCKKAMARSLIDRLGDNAPLNKNRSLENITAALQDLMCPSTTNTEKKQACLDGIDQVVAGNLKRFAPTWTGKNIKCNLNDCQAKVKCKKTLGLFPKAGSCSLPGSVNDADLQTAVTEINAYLEGFRLLGNN